MTLEEIADALNIVTGDIDSLPIECPLETVESGQWVNGGKYEHLVDNIIKDTGTNKTYRVEMYRSGSHWVDYEYYFQGVSEVTQKTIEKKIWVNKK